MSQRVDPRKKKEDPKSSTNIQATGTPIGRRQGRFSFKDSIVLSHFLASNQHFLAHDNSPRTKVTGIDIDGVNFLFLTGITTSKDTNRRTDEFSILQDENVDISRILNSLWHLDNDTISRYIQQYHEDSHYSKSEHVNTAAHEGGQDRVPDSSAPTPLDDADRLALLQTAADHSLPQGNFIAELKAAERDAALALLGGPDVIGRIVTSEAELVDAISTGFPADVIGALRANDVPAAILEKVIAPRRTLMRRKSQKQRLTRTESDAAWRIAWTLGLAYKIFKNKRSALAWMSRPKENLQSCSPFELVESSIGTSYVIRILHQLEWGDVA